MLIIPAVDIQDGKVVRLWKGDFNKVKVYSCSPESVALEWQKQGAQFLHVVDLDGARSGALKNFKSIEEISKAIKIPFQVGGGIRNRETIEKLIQLGVTRVVLGTIAFEDRSLLDKIIKKYKDKIIVSVDITGKGTIALKGWVEDADRQSSLLSFVKAISKIGISKIIYTDIERDGTLSGPRISSLLPTYLNELRRYNVKISMIVAGGVSSLDDIRHLKKFESMGLEGVIVGKALYENRFSLKEALEIMNRNAN